MIFQSNVQVNMVNAHSIFIKRMEIHVVKIPDIVLTELVLLLNFNVNKFGVTGRYRRMNSVLNNLIQKGQ